MPTMEERYIAEMRDREPETVDTLFLDNAEGGKISGINEKLTNLTMLSMVKCGLTSFSGFPNLPALSYLDVSENELSDNAMFDVLVNNAQELERLTLAGNKLSLEDLRPLKMMPKLSELDLTNNSNLGFIENYRDKVFEMIPSLKILDGFDIDGNEVEEDFNGEGGEDSDGGESEEGGPGLSYLNKSQFSDDETDDYVPCEEEKSIRVGKRAASSGNADEPTMKKATNDE